MGCVGHTRGEGWGGTWGWGDSVDAETSRVSSRAGRGALAKYVYEQETE